VSVTGKNNLQQLTAINMVIRAVAISSAINGLLLDVLKSVQSYAAITVISHKGNTVMPISIKTTKNTRTGIRGVQRYGKMYRWRVDAIRFRSLTGQDPTPLFIACLNERESGCVDSARFHTIEDAGDDLCRFLEAMTGVSFEH